MRFTQEQIDQAKQVPVERIAKSVGYTVVKKGRYFSLEEMDSLMINTRKNLWWRYSNGTHGNSIDFLIEFANYSFQQARQHQHHQLVLHWVSTVLTSYSLPKSSTQEQQIRET